MAYLLPQHLKQTWADEENMKKPLKFLVVTSTNEHDCDICKKKIKKGEKCGMRITKIDGRVKLLRKDYVHTKHLTSKNLKVKHVDINNAKSFFIK